jgi:polysaccharide pyruvyl transferase WcaK-like protein
MALMKPSRREFLFTASAAACAALRPGSNLLAASQRRPRILLRNAWQVVNIGDIAHTPGMLALLKRHIPEAEVILWAGDDITPEVTRLLTNRFPGLKVVTGGIKDSGEAANRELQEAIDWSDFLLHGSGARFSTGSFAREYAKHTGKPFGVYGISWTESNAALKDVLSQAKFVFYRDTVSLGHSYDAGVSGPIMQFAPDSAFACDLRNDVAADAFLAANDLQPSKFVCCIPRLRYTPYWLLKNREPDARKAARNEEMKEHDHAILRDAIAAVVRQTGMRVLLCPEDMTHMAVGREMIFDKLPGDVRPHVVWKKDYWLTDEAISTYRRSAGLFGLEMHSPIMCIGHGVPALVGRFEEQTTKGYMWRDIGLGDWLFDFDNANETAQLVPTLLRIISDPAAAKERVAIAQAYVARRQRETMQIVGQQLGV